MDQIQPKSWKKAAKKGALIFFVLSASLILLLPLSGELGSMVLLVVFFFTFYFTGDTFPLFLVGIFIGTLVYAFIGALLGILIHKIGVKKFLGIILLLVVLLWVINLLRHGSI